VLKMADSETTSEDMTEETSFDEEVVEELSEEELMQIEDELFELEDSLIEMQGTTIRSHEEEEEEEELQIQKTFTFNKPEEEEEDDEGVEEDASIEEKLAEFSESMENLEEAKPGQLLAADLTEEGEPQFKAGRYVRETDGGKRLYAGRPGQVVWAGNTVHVLPIMHVEGDVDADTGDIRYDGNIFIEGKVSDNRLVEARGNIWVMGLVGRSRLKASGDIIIRGGIKGSEKQLIQAHGLVYGRFAENARIKAGSKIIIKEVVMHSQLDAEEAVILVDKGGNIIGGETAAGELIVTNDLGSVSYPETKVRMGARGVLQEELEKLEQRFNKLEGDVGRKEKNVSKLKEKKEEEGLTPADEDRLRELQFELNHAREDFQQVKLRIENIEEELDSDIRREIIVRGTVYPGVRLHIGAVREPVEEERNHCTIKVEDKEIKYDSFSEPEEALDFSPALGENLDDFEEKYETPEISELRRHVTYQEEKPLFNREDQFRLFLGLDEDEKLVLIDITPEEEEGPRPEEGEDDEGEKEEGDEEKTDKEAKKWWAIEVREGENRNKVRHYFDPKKRDSVKVRCKSPKEGLEKAAEYLAERPENLAVRILEEGRPGVFGFGKKDYLIRVVKKENIKTKQKGEEEEEETFDLLQQAKQQEDVAGFINLENTVDGLMLTVYPPEGHGLPVTLEQVKEELEDNNYDQDIDWVTVEEMVEEPTGEPRKIGPRQRDPEIDGSFSINMNEYETKAYLTVIPPKPEGVAVTKEEVINYLEGEGINYDKEIVERVFSEELFEEEVLIAEGKDPEHGKDGKIEFKLELEEEEEEEVEEGKVDFREGENVVSVKEGDVLVKVYTPTEGEAGLSVYGEEIPPEPGEDVEIKAGENTSFSADGTEVIADRDGRARLIGDKDTQELIVEPVLEIDGDLDYEVGNIKFDGVVIVKGMILDGFKVEAKQGVEAVSVGKAHVKTEGDVVVEQGLVGRDEGLVEAGGNVFAKYVENCRVKAGGNVMVRQAIMHSKVDAEENVIVDGKRRGDIIGGVTRAGKIIQAQKVGAKLASKTEVEVGISPRLRDRVSKLEDEIDLQKDNMDKVRSGIKGLMDVAEKVGGMDKLPDDKQELRSKLAARAKAIKQRIESLSEELLELKTEIDELEGGEIRVAETLRSGVKVTIQTTTMYMTEDHDNCRFILYEGEFAERHFEALELDIEWPI